MDGTLGCAADLWGGERFVRGEVRMGKGGGHTMAAMRQVSEMSYFLWRILEAMRRESVARANEPNTSVMMTSWWPTGARSAMLLLVMARVCGETAHSW